MLSAKSGRVVNGASIAWFHRVPMSSTYVGTKHAVRPPQSHSSKILSTSTGRRIDQIRCVRVRTDGVTINAVALDAIKSNILQYVIDDGSCSEKSIAEMFPINC